MTSLTRNTSLRSGEELPIFITWLDFVKWLLVVTDGMPKKARFTMSDRLINLSLQIVEDLIEAKYSKNRTATLRRVNMNLEKMRILIRICFETKLMPLKSYEQASIGINEVGKMLGGWIKQQDGYEAARSPI